MGIRAAAAVSAPGRPLRDEARLRAAGVEVVDALSVTGMAGLLAARATDLFLPVAAVTERVHLDAGLAADDVGRERREAADPVPRPCLLEDRPGLVEADDRVVHARPVRLVRVEAIVSER